MHLHAVDLVVQLVAPQSMQVAYSGHLYVAWLSLIQHLCKVLALHGLLTHHVSCAHVRYRCRTAVHIASTLEVQHRLHLELEFGHHSEINIATGFRSKLKSA